MYYTIYKITNQINGKIYVGYHQTENLDDEYMGSGKIIKRAIKKYGIENFTKEYLAIFDNQKEMKKMESRVVNEEFVARKDTYNLKVGGQGGWDHIDFKKRGKEGNRKGGCNSQVVLMEKYGKNFKKEMLSPRISLAMRTKMNDDPEYKRRILHNCSIAFKGKNHSEETKQIMSRKAKARMKDPANNPSTGTCWMYSLEERKNIKVKVDEVDNYNALGYTKGRKMKF